MARYTAEQLRTLANSNENKSMEIIDTIMPDMQAVAAGGGFSYPFPTTPSSDIANLVKAKLESSSVEYGGYVVEDDGGTPPAYTNITWPNP